MIIITVVLSLVSVPIHEAGHFLATKLVGGRVISVVWFSWPPSGAVWIDAPEQWNWFINLAGGVFQGIIYLCFFGTGFFLRKGEVFPGPYNFRDTAIWCFFAILLSLGVVGILTGLAEMYLSPLGRW
ncbi:MAG: hypothetical protein AAB577_01230 [Patescibacteria group bacterium]